MTTAVTPEMELLALAEKIESLGFVGSDDLTESEMQTVINTLRLATKPATPPASHDGAEGVGQESASAAVRESNCSTPRSPASAAMGHCAEADTALPKPAPDAVREAFNEFGFDASPHYGDLDNKVSADELDAFAWRLLNAYAALSAPVPPPDGIMEATPAQHVGRPRGEPAKFVRNGKLEICRCFDCRTLSPGTVAAEPVAFDPTNPHNALKCPYCNPQGLSFAAPPVRGDREAIARIIGGNIFGTPDSEVGPATVFARKAALTKADAILSLPSAPVSEPKP